MLPTLPSALSSGKAQSVCRDKAEVPKQPSACPISPCPDREYDHAGDTITIVMHHLAGQRLYNILHPHSV